MNVNVAPKTSDLTVTPLTGAIGASIRGVNLANLDAAGLARIKAAFREHCMLVFPQQFLEAKAQLAFAAHFGEVSITPMLTTYIDGFPGLLQLTNKGKDKTPTENWHYDSSFQEKPPALSILAAKDLPAMGGDTMWCNQYLAYERLSDGMKAMLAGVRARFCGARLARAHGHDGAIPEAFHPVVRTHPDTGRKALFVGHPETVTNFENMSVAESRPLLDYLYAHSTQPDAIYRHMWKPGDVVMWDNRCTLHYAVHDYGSQVRNLNRVTIAGTKPV
jgi:taurine dioxygenase